MSPRPGPAPAAEGGERERLLRGVSQLASEGPLSAVVRGGSMAPLLADGERVELAPARWPLPGDVVAFRAEDGRLVVHRLLGYRWWRGGLACVTRGDGGRGPDPPVPRARLLGRVRRPARLRPSPARRAAALLAFFRLALRSLLRPLGRRGAPPGAPAG